MIIEKSTIEKILAFTLAEVLITMMVIVLMTLASIPVIKNSKEFRDTGRDKNTWMTFYDAEGNLKVYEDGVDKSSEYADNANGIAKFYPPKGVTKLNVTVVGGGGGGAAGMASTGQSKVFFPESTDLTFVPANEGLYQIVAIGGGGGGGGGAVACDGGGGYTGGAVIAQAKLSPNEVYTVVAGPGGYGGKPQKPLSFILDVFRPVLWIGAAAAAVTLGPAMIAGLGLAASLQGAAGVAGVLLSTGSLIVEGSILAATVETIMAGNQPQDRLEGGGYGINSSFVGINADGQPLVITACGGSGGQHLRKKAIWKCKAKGGGEGCADYKEVGKQSNDWTGTVSHLAQDPWKDGSRKKKPNGYICRDKENGDIECRGDVGTKLTSVLQDMVPSQFGNGGRGGNYRKTGEAGQGGFVQVQEIAVYGGGGGSPGAVSFYTYTKSPLEGDNEYVEVVPGKGGLGGVKNGTDGEDGMFSRFGNRIIADGGLGGKIRATGINPESGTYEAEGKDGISSSLTVDLQKRIKDIISGSNMLEDATGGIKHGKAECKYDGLGNGQSCGKEYISIPGTGGGGGGALGTDDFDWNKVKAGVGGNGASGIVLVTW